jgi:acylphosphatase
MPDNDDQPIARHLIIHGKVQGVYYRASAEARARELGLCGWIRNRRDGTVEAIVGGTAKAVDAFIAWAHEGPPGARVNHIETAKTDIPTEKSFRTEPTA